MTKKMMLELPEVKRLTDRIPVAADRIKANPVQLRFFQHAAESKMPLRKQVDSLGIPWCCRKLPAGSLSKKVRLFAQRVPDAQFMQNAPETPEEIRSWAEKGLDLLSRNVDLSSALWCLSNRAALGQEINAVAGYLRDHPIKSNRVKPKTILERSRNHRKQAVVNLDFYGRMFREVDDGIFEQLRRMVPEREPGTRVRFFGAGGGGGAHITSRDHPSEFVSSSKPDRINYPAPMLAPFQPDGINSIRLLASREEFEEEGRMMGHCVGDPDPLLSLSYYDKAIARRCYIASVTNLQSGARLATVEYDPNGSAIQIRGYGNDNVADPEVHDVIRSFGVHLFELINPSQDFIAIDPGSDEAARVQVVTDAGSWGAIPRRNDGNGDQEGE